MVLTGLFTVLIIVLTVLVSRKGFKEPDFRARYDFEVGKVLWYKDYKRLVTSAFLHVNWWHLIFNMLAFYFFSMQLGMTAGFLAAFFIYFAGITCGNLFALYLRKNNSGYSIIGASAGISAVMFACITLIPGMQIGLFFIPIPGWLVGIAYLLFSMYGIRERREGLGHEAHLAGGILGILIALLIRPSVLQSNGWVILLLLAPSLIFTFLLIRFPHFLIIGRFAPKKNFTVEDRYNMKQKTREEQVDEILEKINKKGIKSLSRKEREILEKYSRP